tara:strand:- start:237 stop:857 length:621 start_codon:yes stop_codon:yes gene_type:complete
MYKFAGGVKEDARKYGQLLGGTQPIVIYKSDLKGWKEQETWFEFHSVTRSSFHETENLKLEGSETYPLDFNSDFPKLHKMFVKWNQDSTLGCDIDSYSLVLEIDEAGNLYSYGGEIDTKVQLISKHDKTIQELMFCGTDCFPELAFWNSTSELVIVGLHFQENYYPAIWTFDFQNDTKRTEISTQVTKRLPSEYTTNIRLKEIEFK